ncbi:MaoC family dehydratase [Streptomyces sp. NP160]|uniref:FAS1-like dehydratase domain-containing protein n=1 Tax=Streptomyces sp. NP160 TaxID=2586637 RepID=UPI001118DA57|nr:MaoC family dehydratase N-terminal domain-containing protein [Streptomyces sp. NP160]TNM69906.1 MaoC family dehydratase [Streptomyces sp. NP160]
MPTPADQVGRTWPPGDTYEVTRAAIAAFAQATGATHPAHVDVDAARGLGHADVVAPPTFLVGLAQSSDARFVEDPASGVDFARVVHGEQRFTLHRPVVAGDRLVAALTVESVRRMAGNDLVTTRNEITTPEGEPVCTSTSMLVVRGE